MFDSTFLPPAEATLAVISDTHQMLAAGLRGAEEFPSRGKQTARATTALRMLSALDADRIIHLGDLVQAYPESPGFEQALAEAQATLRDCGFDGMLVAGNHDVGDKADATMPTNPVTTTALADFHQRFGQSWYGFDLGSTRCVIINSQILNRDDLPEAAAQAAWLERELAEHTHRRLLLFLHLPLYLGHEQEPGRGHYDNIEEPARSWLLQLIRRHGIEQVFAGHVHWRFFDRIDQARYQTAPSPAFTRPGFGHAFTSAAAPEQGRDDHAKLGLLLVRILSDRVDTHLVRTHGWGTLPPAIERGEARWLLTRTSAGLPDSPVGVTLSHELTPPAQVPLAWPSVVRQPIRNDYPFLSLIEMGARHLRTPLEDMNTPAQRARLAMAREEGLSLTAMAVWTGAATPLLEVVNRHRALIDTLELRLPGGAADPALLKTIAQLRQQHQLPMAISPVLPNEQVEGKQHVRTRLGYRLDELAQLETTLEQAGMVLDRVLCRVDADVSPWSFFEQMRSISASQRIHRYDVLVELNTEDDAANARRVAEAVMGAAHVHGTRVYFEPLIDLDRTMDVTHGLLDALCNPRPAFTVLRMLNTIIFSHNEPMHAAPDLSGCALRGDRSALILGQAGRAVLASMPEAARLYDLTAGTVIEGSGGPGSSLLEHWPNEDQSALMLVETTDAPFAETGREQTNASSANERQ